MGVLRRRRPEPDPEDMERLGLIIAFGLMVGIRQMFVRFEQARNRKIDS